MSTPVQNRPVRRLRWIVPALLVIGWLAIGGFGRSVRRKAQHGAAERQHVVPARVGRSDRGGKASRELHGHALRAGHHRGGTTGGLEPADSTFLSQTVDSFVGTEGFGDASSPPIPSADGQALQMFLPVDSTLEVKDSVKALRAALESSPDGLTVKVTAPPGRLRTCRQHSRASTDCCCW